MTDPIADMLTRIRNAQAVRKPEVLIPFSKLKFELARILKREGFIGDIEEVKGDVQSNIKIGLKYMDKEPFIQGLKRTSKPGQRIYKKRNEIRPIKQGLGIVIISTSKGLMTDKQARKKKLEEKYYAKSGNNE